MVKQKSRFFYRLKYYLFGVGLGCIVVWATLLKNRDDRPAWLPEGRVIEFLQHTDIQISDKLKCELKCVDLPTTFMDSTFWANADVDFGKSATKRKPCPEYYISSKTVKGNSIIVYIETCEKEERASLRSIETGNIKNCNCDN